MENRINKCFFLYNNKKIFLSLNAAKLPNDVLIASAIGTLGWTLQFGYILVLCCAKIFDGYRPIYIATYILFYFG
ncbi:MAG: hypothetical protein ACRD7F_05040 [Nitrososphaeraceae archaeon]